MTPAALSALLSLPSGASIDRAALTEQAAALWEPWPQPQRDEAAALALHWGFPSLALAALGEAGEGSLLWAAASLRLGRASAVLAQPWPEQARFAVLRARAAYLSALDGAPTWAKAARRAARTEGDGPALIAAAVLCAENELSREADPRAALRSLAEGLKVAELLGEAADPHLLAVLAIAQARAGGAAKAQRTAEKAYARAQPRSPAHVLALWQLGEQESALAEAEAGELSEGWLSVLAPQPSAQGLH